jgi:hypothetical protein
MPYNLSHSHSEARPTFSPSKTFPLIRCPLYLLLSRTLTSRISYLVYLLHPYGGSSLSLSLSLVHTLSCFTISLTFPSSRAFIVSTCHPLTLSRSPSLRRVLLPRRSDPALKRATIRHPYGRLVSEALIPTRLGRSKLPGLKQQVSKSFFCRLAHLVWL